MSPTDFAAACRDERDDMLAEYWDTSSGSAVAGLLAAANLSPEQKSQIKSAMEIALTDAFYTLLLAIDGSASLGKSQQPFILTDSEGNSVANGDGRLEAAAWEALKSDRESRS